MDTATKSESHPGARRAAAAHLRQAAWETETAAFLCAREAPAREVGDLIALSVRIRDIADTLDRVM